MGDIIEQCAKIAEEQKSVGCDKWVQTEIAKKIRALKQTTHTGKLAPMGFEKLTGGR